MTTTPAGSEPNRPGGPLAPTAPGDAPQPLTKTQKILTGIVVGAVLVIATLGFIGSYSAVTKLALKQDFGKFAHAFPIAVDAGIIAFLALDLLLTWRRIPYPLLRYTAWVLTAATIAFNAVVSWPDPVGTGMHGVIPVLFVIAVEAARHAIGRIAEITADKHIEGPNASRWLLNPIGTFILWRRQRLWAIRKWDTVLQLEQERRIYIGKLRKEYGRLWRSKADAEQLLVLRLAKDGMSITEAIDLPAKEEAKRREEADRIARKQQQDADERRRKDDEYKREQQRLEDERLQQQENERLERERKTLQLEKDRQEAARAQEIADAEHQARLDEIARQQAEVAAQEERRRQQEQIDHAKAVADEQERAAEAAKIRKDAEEQARLEAERKLTAERRTAEVRTALANLNPNQTNQNLPNREPRTATTANHEPARTVPAGTANETGTANHEPGANRLNTRTTNPANLGDRAAAKQNQIVAVVELIDELGFDATTLGVVMDRTGMSKTTAYHRLIEARAVWNQRKAS